jgi:peptide deformylase
VLSSSFRLEPAGTDDLRKGQKTPFAAAEAQRRRACLTQLSGFVKPRVAAKAVTRAPEFGAIPHVFAGPRGAARLYRAPPPDYITWMAVLDIARMGNPILRRRAAEVPDPTAPQIRRLVADMLETMEYAGGTGLAAPQVHVPLRVVVFFVEAERAAKEAAQAADQEVAQAADQEAAPAGSPDPGAFDPIADGGVPLTVLINPEIEVVDATAVMGLESCLSVPGLAGEVPRLVAIRYRGRSLDGSLVERAASGFHARVVQHECDHLDGILYPQRMTDLSRLTFNSELERAARHAPAEA